MATDHTPGRGAWKLIAVYLLLVAAIGLLFWYGSTQSPEQPTATEAPATAPEPAAKASPTAAVPKPDQPNPIESGAGPANVTKPAARKGEKPLENFDVRASQPPATPTPAQEAALAELRSQIPGVDVQFDPITRAPSHIMAAGRMLTGPGPTGDDLHAGVKQFIDRHAELFGHPGSAVPKARTAREDVTPHNKMRTVVWEQLLDGVPLYSIILKANLAQDGRVITIGDHFMADPERASRLAPEQRTALIAQPPIDAGTAIAQAAASLGDEIDPAAARPISEPKGAERRQKFEAPGLSDTQAGLSWLPMGPESVRLAWDITLMSPRAGAMFRVVVDAQSGEVLLRTSLTNDLSNATYRVFADAVSFKPLDSPSPFTPGHATALTTQPPEASRSLVTLSALDPVASPNGWINDGGTQTTGNNVDAHLDLLDINPAYNSGTHAVSASRTFDFPLDLTQEPTTYQDAVITQLFYATNWYHDRMYQLGFTESAGNFQQNNFGRGGNGNDAVLADAQDGGGTNNANFSTPTDGGPGRMQMYIFPSPTPDRDGSLDMEVVLHELTHGLSNRLVGGGVGMSALQSRGMGEGWSDFYGMCLLSDPADDVNGNYAAGGYLTYELGGLTSNYYYGIRRYPYSTDLLKNPLTLKDIDPTRASFHAGIPISPIFGGSSASEVHAQGEVWCVTLWDMRANLIAKLGAAAGNQMALLLTTDGMKLSPANPTFLQSRDAILQADLVNNAGANRLDLYRAFAKRGMGASASVPANSSTTGVLEAYDLPDDLNVSPTSLFSASGPLGGPFSPSAQIYTLTNTGAATISWSVSASVPWLTLSQTSGSLAPGAVITVTASLNAAAAALAAGSFSATITFRNDTNGATIPRAVSLGHGLPDYFTEIFDTSANDTDNQSWLFTPAGGANFYAVRRSLITAFPTDPTGGATLTLGDDNFVTVTPAAGATLSLYGTSYPIFYVGSNGYVTFGSGDSSLDADAASHFARARIAALMEDLDPRTVGKISWRQLADRIAVTYENVPTYGLADSNSFQIEMFFDGRIRISCLGIAHAGGLIGLSRGTGTPANFTESDFSAYPMNGLQLTVPTSAVEGAGVLAGQGRISRVAIEATPLTVTLVSSKPGEVAVPAIVTIPGGQASATFDLTILDDPTVDGSQPCTITASVGTDSAVAAITVDDNETATLSLTLPASVTEGGTAQGTVTISSAPSAPVAVALLSGDLSAVSVPTTVTVPAGATSAPFTITGVDDIKIDGSQTATITARVTNWTQGSGTIEVLDDEKRELSLTLPASVTEGAAGTATITLSGTLPTPVVVALMSADIARLSVPATATIPANTLSVNVPLTAVDNNGSTPATFVVITATTDNFKPASGATIVRDNDAHHLTMSPIASPRIRGFPFSVTVTAHDATGAVLTTYTGAVSITGTGASVSPAASGAFTAGRWTGNLRVDEFADNVVVKAVDALGNAVSSNPFNVSRGAMHHFTWEPVPGPQIKDQRFAATVTARDVGENVVPSFTGTASLYASAANPDGGSSVVITEVNADTPDEIEFMNVSAQPVDISGWKIYLYDDVLWPAPLTAFTIPAGTTCAAGALFRLQEAGAAPGAYPLFFYGSNISWNPLATSRVAVLLCDAAGAMVDFFCATAGTPAGITSPGAIPAIQWSGSTVSAPGNGTFSYARVGNGDANTSGNWLTAARGFGAANPGLTTPFPALSVGVNMTPTVSAAFQQGAWSGQITLLGAAQSARLIAVNGPMFTGTSNAFDVVSLGTLELTLPASATEGGAPVTATVRLPLPLATDTKVYFFSSAPAELSVPASILIPAGSTSGEFTITPGDDADLDGPKEVTITASAQYFTHPTGTMKSLDNETATLTVTAPASAVESAGQVQGSVQVSTAPTSDFTISLASSDATAVQVPATVTIAAGQTSVPFTLTIVDDAKVDGAQTATITAHFAPLTDGAATVSVEDDEPRSLTLTLPAQVTEGAGAAGSVAIAGPFATDLRVNLVSADAARVGVPVTVTIPKGSTSIEFPITAPDNAELAGQAFVVVMASAPSFTGSSAATILRDNDAQHFSFAPIGRQGRGAPFTASITAHDVNGRPVGFTGNVTLTAAGSTGPIAISPGAVGAFANGVWTGTLQIDVEDPAVAITATDSAGRTGASNPFEVSFGALHHFRWPGLAGSRPVNTPFAASLIAEDAAGNRVRDFSGSAGLSGTRSVNTSSIMLITEVNTGTEEVELQVLGTSSVSVTGWKLYLYDDVSWPAPRTVFSFPSTGFASGQIVRVQKNGTAPGAFPLYRTGAELSWEPTASSHVVALLTNASGAIVDFFCAGAATPRSITSPAAVPASQWSSSPVSAPAISTHSYQRQTNVDYDSTVAWTAAAPSPGTQNSGLVRPFTAVTADVNVFPAETGPFVEGAWSGDLTISQVAAQVRLLADDRAGNFGQSDPFSVSGTTTLTVNPFSGVTAVGLVGGPFSPAGATYLITNTGTSPMNWTASRTNTFLNLSATSGLLAPGASTAVTVAIDPSAATLAAGSYSSTITFTNASLGTGSTSRVFNLAISTTTPALTVTPTTSGNISGPAGGGFTPSSVTYTLRNNSAASLSWSHTHNASWCSTGVSNGTLAPGATTTVVATMNASANSLAQGLYADMVTITNTTNGSGTTSRPIMLTVTTANPVLSVSPATPFSAGGIAGGTLTPSSASYTVTNTGTTNLAWTAAKTAPWLTLSSAGGTLGPGLGATVTVSLNSAAAALAAGSYSDAVTFTNTGNGNGNTTRTVQLEVTAPTRILSVTPATGLSSSGNAGGPFTPSNRTYTLSNMGNGSMAWSATKTAPWLTLSSASGTLAPGASTNVSVIINSSALTLAAGSFSDTVNFTNTVDGVGTTTRNVSLAVGAAFDLDANGLPDAWESRHRLTTGPHGDPTGSGVDNITAYALGLDPRAIDHDLLPTTSLKTNPADDLPYLTFTYRRRTDDPSLKYTIELSSDLVKWKPAADELEQVQPPTANLGGETETVAVRIKPAVSPETPARYVRLRVSTGP